MIDRPADVAVLVPVLGRPERVAPFLESLYRSQQRVRLRPVYIVSPGDLAQERAVQRARADYLMALWPAGPGDYARKINLGYNATSEPWLFLGADDLCFCEGWADRALEACEGKRVIGTNDLGNQRVTAGLHSTHSLVHRSYADEYGTIDGDGILCEEYTHNFLDDELVATAKARGEFCFAADSHVEHLHPSWGKAGWDATYTRGQEHFAADRALFQKRKKLWQP